MKIIIFLIISLSSFFIGNASASQKSSDIVSNKEVDFCILKFGDNNDECLSEISEKSEKQLKKVYDKKLKILKSFEYNQWWMGSEEQKQQMITKFISSQKIWINYRDIFCQTAVTGAQNTHDSGNAITSCTLNMNERRIDEIHLINANLAD